MSTITKPLTRAAEQLLSTSGQTQSTSLTLWWVGNEIVEENVHFSVPLDTVILSTGNAIGNVSSPFTLTNGIIRNISSQTYTLNVSLRVKFESPNGVEYTYIECYIVPGGNTLPDGLVCFETRGQTTGATNIGLVSSSAILQVPPNGTFKLSAVQNVKPELSILEAYLAFHVI